MGATSLCLAISVDCHHRGHDERAWCYGALSLVGWAVARFGWRLRWEIDDILKKQ